MAETPGSEPSPMTNEELAERIGYKIESLLTDKYTNSLKIAIGIIRQELEKDVTRVAMAEPSRGAPDAQREAFEKWATSKDMSVLRYGGKQFALYYLDGATDRAWEVWQVAAASSNQHHWNKYHNLDKSTAFMGGEFYLGGQCQGCKFGVSDRIAESGHVVLLEALRVCQREIFSTYMDEKSENRVGSATKAWEMAEAAIRRNGE